MGYAERCRVHGVSTEQCGCAIDAPALPVDEVADKPQLDAAARQKARELAEYLKREFEKLKK